jgi:hypothetical protein
MTRPRKTDPLNWTLRWLALNAAEWQKWPAGSRGRNYVEAWLASKSSEVMG